jgi:hypothetical protein
MMVPILGAALALYWMIEILQTKDKQHSTLVIPALHISQRP